MRFTVCMPMYNNFSQVSICVDAFYYCTTIPLEEWEFLIIDDGSDDLTQHLLKELQKYPNLRVIRREKDAGNLSNCGVPKNVGIRRAKGRYIGLMDSDIVHFTDPIKLSLECLERAGKEKVVIAGKRHKVFPNNEVKFKRENGRMPVGFWYAMKVEYLREIGGYDERFTVYGECDKDILGRLQRMHRFEFIVHSGILAVHLRASGMHAHDLTKRKKQIDIALNDKTIKRNEGINWGATK